MIYNNLIGGTCAPGERGRQFREPRTHAVARVFALYDSTRLCALATVCESVGMHIFVNRLYTSASPCNILVTYHAQQSPAGQRNETFTLSIQARGRTDAVLPFYRFGIVRVPFHILLSVFAVLATTPFRKNSVFSFGSHAKVSKLPPSLLSGLNKTYINND